MLFKITQILTLFLEIGTLSKYHVITVVRTLKQNTLHKIIEKKVMDN